MKTIKSLTVIFFLAFFSSASMAQLLNRGCTPEVNEAVAIYQDAIAQYKSSKDIRWLEEAYPYWKQVVEKCPMQSKVLYTNGINIMRVKIAKAKNQTERNFYLDELMNLYDVRIAMYGEESQWTALKSQELSEIREREGGKTPCPLHYRDYTNTTERTIMENIENYNDGIVGIYEDVISGGYKLGVIKKDNTYRIVYLSGGNTKCWRLGHIKAILHASATPGLFKATWYMADFSENNTCVISFDGVKMNVVLPQETSIYLKMYPSSTSTDSEETNKWTGSGWALENGYVVTNNHVIEDSRAIIIKGIEGNFNAGYRAEVVATDKINDIAILKIKDSGFDGYGTIPYGVSNRMAEVGEDIFVLGYPLTQTMGEEIKLTNGIISSRTGFQGDVANYQMSAPIQPGNSGGPMFDSKGNVIGIVCAHHAGAENAGYAIKISYLKILIESAGLNITFPSNNTISTMSLSEKVKRVKNFVYYIECSK